MRGRCSLRMAARMEEPRLGSSTALAKATLSYSSASAPTALPRASTRCARSMPRSEATTSAGAFSTASATIRERHAPFSSSSHQRGPCCIGPVDGPASGPMVGEAPYGQEGLGWVDCAHARWGGTGGRGRGVRRGSSLAGCWCRETTPSVAAQQDRGPAWRFTLSHARRWSVSCTIAWYCTRP